MSRHCGPCQLCCEVVAVEPLDKPEHQRCRFQGARGCSIYEERPDCCRVFTCGWLAGAIPRELRPDRCGAVFWSNQIVGMVGNFPIIECSMKRGVKPSPKVMGAVLKISEVVPCSLGQGSTQTLYQRRKEVLRWRPDIEFFTFDIDGEGLMVNARTRSKAEVLAEPGASELWAQAQERSKTVPETGKWRR